MDETTELNQDAELFLGQGNGFRKFLWGLDDELDGSADRPAAELGTGLANVGFIRAALRRSAWVWCLTAVIGLLGGIAYYKVRPPAAQASATVLLPPATYPAEILDDQFVAESHAVAAKALKTLHVHVPIAVFAKDIVITAPTDRVLIFTAKAPTSASAISDANAMAHAFLNYQAYWMHKGNQLVTKALASDINQAEQQISSISSQIRQLSSQTSSPATTAKLTNLRRTKDTLAAGLINLKQANLGNGPSMSITSANTIKRSRVLDAAYALPVSLKRSRVAFAIIGLVFGLVLGAALVVIRALVSDRLRRRDDVARVIGAPVRLSIRMGRLRRRRVAHRGLGAAQDPELSRVIGHLVGAVTPTSRGFASLAVVAVDEVAIAAICLTSLALASARRGLKVVIADLCAGVPAARLLGVTEPGVGEEVIGDARLVVVVPDRDDVLLRGPLSASSYDSQHDPLAAECASADLVLTFATLDPALGGDHLGEWASGVVTFITAGRSPAQQIYSVGEMIRLAGIQDISAVLIGADKTDGSLGVVPVSDSQDRLSAGVRANS